MERKMSRQPNRWRAASLLALFFLGIFAGIGSTGAFGQLAVDPALKPYKAVPGVSGQIKSVGSDSMNPLMLLWTEKFKTYYKGVVRRWRVKDLRRRCRR